MIPTAETARARAATADATIRSLIVDPFVAGEQPRRQDGSQTRALHGNPVDLTAGGDRTVPETTVLWTTKTSRSRQPAPANQLPSALSAPEGVGLPVLLYYRVPVAGGGGEHPDHVVDARAPERSVEPSISEAEHPTVLGHQPVALAVGRRCYPHGGLVEDEVSGGAVERGVAE